MWFRNILRPFVNRAPINARRRRPIDTAPLFDELFLRRLERLSLQAQRTLRGHPASGGHVSRQYLPASEFSDHRPYIPGDDLRYVDWHAYARQNEMLLKLGEAEQDINVHLLLDVSRSMAWGIPSKRRSMQRLAGALGYLALTYGDKLHIVPFGNQPARAFGPARGKGRLVEMLRYIEHGMPVQQYTDMRTVIQQQARAHKRGGMVVICSDLLMSHGLAEGLSMLPPPRWQPIVLHILDPRELHPELQGPMELEDSETGLRMTVSLNAEQLAYYRRSVTQWQERLARTCARYGATYAQIHTTWPLEQRVVPYLRARRMLV